LSRCCSTRKHQLSPFPARETPGLGISYSEDSWKISQGYCTIDSCSLILKANGNSLFETCGENCVVSLRHLGAVTA
jgi:hypothetical protein